MRGTKRGQVVESLGVHTPQRLVYTTNQLPHKKQWRVQLTQANTNTTTYRAATYN